jgi:hypothetical protein
VTTAQLEWWKTMIPDFNLGEKVHVIWRSDIYIVSRSSIFPFNNPETSVKPFSTTNMQSTHVVLFLIWLWYSLSVESRFEEIEFEKSCQFLHLAFPSDFSTTPIGKRESFIFESLMYTSGLNIVPYIHAIVKPDLPRPLNSSPRVRGSLSGRKNSRKKTMKTHTKEIQQLVDFSQDKTSKIDFHS